jgi:hypothetical protein
MNIDGKSGVFLKVPGLGQTILVIFHKERQGISGEQEKGPALLVAFCEVSLQLPGVGLKIKDDIQHPPENGEEHDKENPGKFIGGFFFFIDYINTNHNTHHIQSPPHIEGMHTGVGDKVQYERYLYKQKDYNKNSSSEHSPEPFFFFHRILRLR